MSMATPKYEPINNIRCVRCGAYHRGPLSVCEDCDAHPRCQSVDELLAEISELRQQLACERSELDQLRLLCVRLDELCAAQASRDGARVRAADHQLTQELPGWRTLLGELTLGVNGGINVSL